MTTFADLEESLESSRPIELYQFALGATVCYYTSAEDEITLGSDVYTPENIQRSAPEVSAEGRTKNLIVTVPPSNAFVAQYVSIVPGQRATVTVIRLQRDEVPFGTQVLLFKGVIQSVRFVDDATRAEVTVRSLENSLNQNIPKYGYGGMCNHVLYGPGCDVNPLAFDFTGTVASVSGKTITLTGASGSGFDFTGGHCKPTAFNDFRLIVAQSGDVLTLLLPFAVNVTGLSVQAFAGCDHLVDGDCANVFDNVINFGGFAWVPNRNPFSDGLDV